MKFGLFVVLSVILYCTSANILPTHSKSKQKTILTDRLLQRRLEKENPDLKPKDSFRPHLVKKTSKDEHKDDHEKSAEHDHEKGAKQKQDVKLAKKQQHPKKSMFLGQPLGSRSVGQLAVKPDVFERVSTQHIRQQAQQVQGHASRYGRGSHVDGVVKVEELMRHAGEISREDEHLPAEAMPPFLKGHQAMQSGHQHGAHEGHAPLVDPDNEEGHEHPKDGTLTGKHSESLHKHVKQKMGDVHGKHAESIHRGKTAPLV